MLLRLTFKNPQTGGQEFLDEKEQVLDEMIQILGLSEWVMMREGFDIDAMDWRWRQVRSNSDPVTV
jgi:hypothetical protein